MAQKNYFPLRPDVTPMIYAYSDESYPNQLKIGYTTRNVKERVAEQYPIIRPGNEKPYTIVFTDNAIREDGTTFDDHELHRYLRRHGKENTAGEWFICDVEDVKAAYLAVRNRTENDEARTEAFPMRPEQERAVQCTKHYFESIREAEPDKTPHFLWNCKMRFGKTFATYQLAKAMGWTRILVLTFKPAVQSAWEDDLLHHADFEGWQFYSHKSGTEYDSLDKSRPIVCFGSFQDFLGKNKAGGIKAHNTWVHVINWDCVVLDEYHYGAWRENAKDLFYEEDDPKNKNHGGLDYFDEQSMPITTNHYLYLSGTPFRAINSGEFIEEQIYNWTYSDEQQAKEQWKGSNNPYAMLPQMVLMTYQLPEEMERVAKEGENNEFDLNEFFRAEGNRDHAEFIHKDEVQKWLQLIRGSYTPSIKSDLKLGKERPPMPFSHAPLLKTLSHTFWFLPGVDACYAMKNLMMEPQNTFYHDYDIIVAAGIEAGIGMDAIEPVKKAMHNPLETKTITLSCGKLTIGVTVKPWSGIFMLRNSSSPETYFQAAFRVQSPWTINNPDGSDPNHTEILKQVCYVFDFAPNRALQQIADYSCRLNVNEKDPEKKVADFISFLPVLAYDGSSMKAIDAAEILDFVASGTSATLLARRWESALLVNVDNGTLQRLLDTPEALEALMRIEGFRSLKDDISTIINKSNSVKNIKKMANEKDLTTKENKELTEEEKDIKRKRKEIQEKLIKFATRIPVFMYLTDYREQTLEDVITQLEPGLFLKVTSLTIKDFNLLVSLNVFNSALMNDAVYKFKRYEESSLSYIGFDCTGKNSRIGLWDTTIERDELETIVNEDLPK